MLTRRGFLRAAAGTVLAASAGAGIWGEAKAQEKARVVLIRDFQAVQDDGTVDPDVVQGMLDGAMKTLFGKDNPVAAWKEIV
jgi:hypothetical protein